MIFVILCMSTFGILSLVLAREDLHLSKEAALATEQFYAADAQTDEIIERIDKALTDCVESVLQNGLSQAEYADLAAQSLAELFPQCVLSGNKLSIDVPVGQTRTLRTQLTLLPFTERNNYRVESSSVIADFEWEGEESPAFELFPRNK
jgi:hypothetical protein